MELYSTSFAALALVNALLAWYCRTRPENNTPAEQLLPPSPGRKSKQQVQNFKTTYFGVYVLVIAADWLQGPYMYTVYKDEKNLPERVVASLFTTGFASAGIAALVTGSFADEYGRRLACLIFCVAYSISCLTMLSDDLWILYAGRALGGFSTTLLYSAFETWMVGAFYAQDLDGTLRLSDMFSLSVTLSSLVAIVAGVVGETVVSYAETKLAPFMVAVGCLAAALIGICVYWEENFAEVSSTRKAASTTTLRMIALDKRLLTLAFTTMAFEGSMYLFVYFWSPAVIASRHLSGTTEPPPFGIIFSCFMAAMMIGSLIFSMMDLRREMGTARLLLSTLALAANALLLPVAIQTEAATFWSFAVFETCVGLYFPSMSRLKSDMVDDSIRGQVYGLMRVPLNVFVVFALGVTRAGDAHRQSMFIAMGVLLLAALFVVRQYLL